jgi:hypothetical protein
MSLASRLVALICAPAYGLRRSRIAGLSAYTVLLFLCFTAAAFSAFRGWQGGFTSLRSLEMAASLFLVALLLWAHSQRYLVFHPKAWDVPDDTRKLAAEEKLRLCGSGLFAVSDMARYLVEVPVFFWSTRLDEFVVAAQVRPFNLLGAGVPLGERGWWYVFLQPSQVLDLVSGVLGFGLRWRPAVQVVCQTDRRRENIYLSCEDAHQLTILLKELRYKCQVPQAQRSVAPS